MKVKADSKGRLTGAKALSSYDKHYYPDGTLTYTPTIPEKFDEIRDVTQEEFEAFFGVSPRLVSARESIETQPVSEPGYIPTGLVLTRFVEDENGVRKLDGTGFARETTLIRIRRNLD